jgi:hypothetical protein
MRALAYFHLVNGWGGVPIYTDPAIYLRDDYILPRNTVEEVHTFIIEDLLFAQNQLPLNRVNGRVDQGAVKALLGKTYLYREDYNNAVSVFSELIDNEAAYGYGLEEDLNDIFNIFNEFNRESVFELGFTPDPGDNNWIKDFFNAGSGALRPQYFAPSQVNGWENTWPTESLINEFEDSDPRKDAWLYLPGDPIKTLDPATGQFVENTTYDPELNLTTTGTNIQKIVNWYPGQNISTNIGFDDNRVLIRYADVLLMYAEALHKSGNDNDAKEIINRVRKRAFKLDNYPTVDDYMRNSSKTLMEAIKHERRVELCYEGHRFFDLKRWGDDVAKLGARGYQSYMYYLPIPPTDIETSNGILEQNPGY